MSRMFGLMIASGIAAVGASAHPCAAENATSTTEAKAIPSNEYIDAQYVGNGRVGAAIGGNASEILLYVGSNDFWSTNTAPDVFNYTSRVRRETALSMGTATLSLPSLSGVSYTSVQSYGPATVNLSLVTPGSGWSASVSVYAANDEETLLVDVLATCSGCSGSASTNMTVTLSTVPSTQAPVDTETPLPARAGVISTASASGAYIGRQSVSQRENSFILNYCGLGGQFNTSQQLFVDAANARIVDAAGRCVLLHNVSNMVAPTGGRRITIGDCNTPSTGDIPFPANWVLTPAAGGGVHFVHNATGLRASVPVMAGQTEPGPLLQTLPLPSSPSPPGGCDVFQYDAAHARLVSSCAFTSRYVEPPCVTVVEPNRMVRYIMTAVPYDAATDAPLPPSEVFSPMATNNTASFTVTLQSGAPITLVMPITLFVDPTNMTDDPLADATARGVGNSPAARADAHAAWWSNYWNASAVVLGANYSILQNWYCSMQYMLASGTRPGAIPGGLWGPWITTDTPAWSNDYTTDYNFQAQFFGVMSDNRPDFALPMFDVMEAAFNASLWRAARPQPAPPMAWTYGHNADAMLPGLQTAEMMWPASAPNTTGWAGIEMVTHLTPWAEAYFVRDLGVRWCAALSAALYAQYADFTGDAAFLSQRAYPWIKQVAQFYVTYGDDGAGGIRLRYACAQEDCGAQGKFGSLDISENPTPDIALGKLALQKAIEYSLQLDVDARLRTRWQAALAVWPEWSLTTNPADGASVLSQIAGTGDGKDDGFPAHVSFPNGTKYSYNGNARYPITYYAGMHPAGLISLSANASLLDAARRTVDAVNSINSWVSTNGLCLSWPSASRITPSAEYTLGQFQTALQMPGLMMRNGWPKINNLPDSGSGCVMEQAGATVAINDLFVTAHEGFIRYFPGGWASSASASFTTLRVAGAFLASGGVTTGMQLQPLMLTSLVGNPAAVLNAWAPATVCAQQWVNNAWIAVNTTPQPGPLPIVAFNTTAGGLYQVMQC